MAPGRAAPNASAEAASRQRALPLAARAALASVAVALFLLALKAWAAWRTDSVAMLGSLADTALDLLASLVTLYGVRLAAAPADHDHRFGHGKAEALAALFQVALITLSAAAIAWHAAAAFRADTAPQAAGLGIGVSLVGIAATLGLIAYQRSIVRRTGSVAIRADSLHYQGDVALGLAVIAAFLLELFAGVRGADPVIGIAIALWLAWNAWRASTHAVDMLMDKEWSEERRAAFMDVAARQPGVRGIHDFRTRRSGAHDFAQFHMEVARDMSVADAHVIVERVERALAAAFPAVEVLIHLDPEGHIDTDNPLHEADATPAWFGKRF